MKWVRRSAITLAVLLVALGLFVAWLVGTTSGARWVLARVDDFLPHPLAIESVNGTLAGELTLRGVRFGSSSAALTAVAQRITLDVSLIDLLRGLLHVRSAHVHELQLTLHEQQRTTATNPSSSGFDLQPPIDMVVDAFTMTDSAVHSEEQMLVEIRRLQAAGRWTSEQLRLDRFSLAADQGQVQLQGLVDPGEVIRATAEGHFRWRTGNTTVAGRIDVATHERTLVGSIRLSQPASATLDVRLSQRQSHPWSFELKLPKFNADAITEMPLDSLAAELRGQGTQRAGTITGRLWLNGEPLRLAPVKFSLAEEHVNVDATILVARSEGHVRLTGTTSLEDETLHGDLRLVWEQLQLPEAWAGQTLRTRGELHLTGSPQDYSAEGEFKLGPPQRMANIEVSLSGSSTAIDLKQLAIDQPDGLLTAQGEVQFQPIRWDVNALADSFNPGELFPRWPGNLNFRLTTSGTLRGDAPAAELHLENLHGTLRDHRLTGGGDLRLSATNVLSGRLRLASDDSHILVRGARGEEWDAQVQMEIAALSEWWPDMAGHLQARAAVSGTWPDLHIEGTARARDLHHPAVTLDSATMRADVTNPMAPHGSVRVQAEDIAASGFTFETASLRASGDPAQHSMTLSATGDPLDLQIRVAGQRKNEDAPWRETIQHLVLDADPVGRFALAQPTALTIAWPGVTLERGCLKGPQAASICLAGRRAKSGALQARYDVEQMPLQVAGALAPALPVDLRGVLQGQGELRRTDAGQLLGELSLRSPQGSVAPTTSEAAKTSSPLLTYEDLQAEVKLNGTAAHALVSAQLNDRGTLSGNLRVANLDGVRRPIEGAVRVHITDLAALTLLSTKVADVHGDLRMTVAIDGTVSDPQLNLEAHAAQLRAEVPQLGIELRNGSLDVRSRSGDMLALRGSIQSGQGAVQLRGTAQYSGAISLDITGQRFLAADMPGAHVQISPDLTFNRTDERMAIRGQVRIPSARVDVDRLPARVSAETESPDTVIVGVSQPPERMEEQIPLHAEVEIILGDEISVAGLGFQTQVDGRLTVYEQPNEPATASGELRLVGKQEAYGQDLTITQGSLLFADTPLDNPALRITAARQIGDVTAGLQIGGTAQSPEINVFSNPDMDQSNSLSYLIAGRPLEVGAAEDDPGALRVAAQSLGTVAGGLLAKPLGDRLGVDTVGVESSEVLDGAAFTVGEFLSPRLYVSYGLGLFQPGGVLTLRYRLSEDFALRAIRGPEESRAELQYRMER